MAEQFLDNQQGSTGRTHGAAVAVILDGDKFLIIKRSANVRAPGQYCFPGGGIEAGESNEQAPRSGDA